VAIPVHASHVPERLALFTIIVLGETIVVAALGTSDPEWALSAVVAVLGFLVASAVWWIYFGSGSEVALRPSPTSIVVFVYAHIPLLLALTAVSAGISLAIEQSSAAGLGAGGSPGARRRRRRLPRLRHRRTSGQGPRCLGRCAAIADRSSHGACRPRARRGVLDPVVFMAAAASVLVGVVVVKLWAAERELPSSVV
jgi:Bacterial low temperature requirement A protein (LtrA)